ncbi:DUF6950 family protein [Pararhodobacter zhoushanensis]|uniref:DUF6950 family protein n=1 Tax=Pararhodobacter zhoushanensis TaxID=2479545 RepID=UPI0013E037A1|nr:hypothetical protein [Pararhodobacter zhoushanensis]
MDAVLDVMSGPWVWGVSDCCTAACDVFQRLHGIDAMAPLRGRYSTEAGAYALIRDAGGWRRLFMGLAAESNLKPGDGSPGEIGLIRAGGRRALAISVGGDMWASRVDGGFATFKKVILSCQS